MSIKPPKFLANLLLWALCGGIFLVCVRYLLPWMLPFLIALGLAALLEPAVRLLTDRARLPRAAAAGACTLLLLAALVTLTVWGAAEAAGELVELTGRLPELLGSVLDGLESLESRVMRYIGSAPVPVREYLGEALDSLEGQLAAIPAALSGRLPGLISAAVEKTPLVLLFAVTAGLGTYFVSASYPAVKSFALRQIPEKFRDSVRAVRGDLSGTLGRWLRAQGLLMAVTFAVLSLGFLLLRIGYPLLVAAVTAVIDALPILGTGTVLIPWALYCFLTGSYARGAGLALCYAAATVLRSTLQAKLIGDQLGLHPIVSLFSIYLGFRVCGVLGMLLFPLAAVMLCRMNERGIIRLWK